MRNTKLGRTDKNPISYVIADILPGGRETSGPLGVLDLSVHVNFDLRLAMIVN